MNNTGRTTITFLTGLGIGAALQIRRVSSEPLSQVPELRDPFME